MEKLKDASIYIQGDGGVIRIPKVFFKDHNMKENKEIEIHSDTLEDGRKALVIIPKIQIVSSSEPAHQTA